MHLKVIATIEARMGSSRLPGKVLFPANGKPMLQHMVERVQKSALVDEVVIATVKGKDNDPIVDLAESLGIPYYRGSEDNVLLRVVEAARSRQADVIVQLTGDCPLIDPDLIDECVETFMGNNWDYVANELIRSYPIGFDVAVMSVDLLASTVHKLDLSERDKEHVTTYIVDRPDEYRLLNVKARSHLDHPELEVTLDTSEDYKLLRQIIEKLSPEKPDFKAADVINYLLDYPEVARLNESVIRKSKK